MRRGGSSSSSSSAAANGGGGGGLAITERQKPAPSRVVALFQMLAKRKLFSSSSSKKTKLLAPAREQRFFSPGRPPGGGGDGGEKTPVAKKRPLLLDSADYARRKSESHDTNRLPPPTQDSNSSEMCTPGVVARLMGLSSMPAISHERSARATDSSASDVDGHRNECSQSLPGSSGSMSSLHQRQQKPGQVMDEWHENTGKFSADSQALWSGRHQNHKVASPLKSPRSISSRNKARLIEAAARVLEPGLQSRNRHRAQRHARLEYPCNGDGVATTAVAVVCNLPDQFSRDTRDVDAPTSDACNIGATSLYNSTSGQWSEQNCKKIAADRKPKQNVPWQGQPAGNIKVLAASSSSEKARVKESDEMIFNATAGKHQDVRKVEPRNVSRGNVASGPLKQNNLKQNALPTVSRTEDPQHMNQRQKHRSGEQYVASTGKDFVSLNKSMNSSTSLRPKGKAMDEIRLPRSNAQLKNLSTKGHRTSGLRSDSSNKPKPRSASPKAMEKDMVIAKGAGLVSEKPKTASANYARNDLLRPVEPRNASRCNDSDIVSFTFSSPMKAIPSSLPSKNNSAVLGSANGPKRNSHRDSQNICSEKELVYREKLQGPSSTETAESVCFNRDELKNRDIHGNRVRVTSSWSEQASDVPVLQRSSSEELLRELDSLMHVFGELPNSVELRETHKKLEANGKANDTSRSVPGGNRQRGRLRPTYSDENCTFGNSNYTKESQLEDRRLSETCAPPSSARDATTERNAGRAEPNPGQHGARRLAPAVQGSKPAHAGPGEVTSTVDLLLTSVCSSGVQNSKEAFLQRTSESVLATLTPRSSGNNNSRPKATGANPLRSLAVGLVTECLESMSTQLCDSGFMSFTRLAVTIRTEQRLSAEVWREAARRGTMAGQALDDLAAGDVERAVAAGVAREAFRIGALIERDLVQELVHEVGQDMLRAAAVNL
ncbi:hypothetical protein D1007_30088 [Hordeum vulgare]|uniref:DUF3741 domain-containing protein n=1 Tax=Hordeum vulgare subsp. vulgare TaxID=112509 RepID=A0A8I6X6N2_HORVV|nr:uncharacterized protein LOC123449292 [Hordeum vulgare subsp. vulgare]KAE8794902.1 hypothetical protein D1007_30088 [Hordeum vulgare]KAI5020014.1 hypothetical protein ZWY2020_044902 [Hordeum vulgare]